MKIKVKTNGYEIGKELETMKERFEYVSSVLFPKWKMEHFYYGNKLIMTDIKDGNGRYAHFNITANRVSLNGYTASREQVELFGRMTWNDECYNGRLLKLVNF